MYAFGCISGYVPRRKVLAPSAGRGSYSHPCHCNLFQTSKPPTHDKSQNYLPYTLQYSAYVVYTVIVLATWFGRRRARTPVLVNTWMFLCSEAETRKGCTCTCLQSIRYCFTLKGSPVWRAASWSQAAKAGRMYTTKPIQF